MAELEASAQASRGYAPLGCTLFTPRDSYQRKAQDSASKHQKAEWTVCSHTLTASLSGVDQDHIHATIHQQPNKEIQEIDI